MNLGEWLGAIPNAIGKFMYDAGIPDPMADQYAKKQQFDLAKRKNEEIIKRYKMDNDVNEALAGIAPKMDKSGKMVFLPGVMGQLQQDVFVNGVKPHEAIQKYGAQLGAVGGITPDKMQMAALSPEQFLATAEIKGGLRQSANQAAQHGLNVAKFQNEALRNNAKDTMTLIAKINDEGGDPQRVGALMNNMALALGKAGFKPEVIKDIMIPIQEVASGRKDIDLDRKIRQTENTIAQGWARVNIAAQRLADGRKEKELDASKIKIEDDIETKMKRKELERIYGAKEPNPDYFDGVNGVNYKAKLEEHEAKRQVALDELKKLEESNETKRILASQYIKDYAAMKKKGIPQKEIFDYLAKRRYEENLP